MRSRFPKVRSHCAECGHHVSVHRYRPHPEGRTDQGPQDCRLCMCPVYKQAVPFQRIKRGSYARRPWVKEEVL